MHASAAKMHRADNMPRSLPRNPGAWRAWAAYGALAVEMETAGLYTLAAKFNVDALSILTVSDSLVTEQATSAEERERGFSRMAEIALEASA